MALRDTPFRVVYGHDPPMVRSYEASELQNTVVEAAIKDRG